MITDVNVTINLQHPRDELATMSDPFCYQSATDVDPALEQWVYGDATEDLALLDNLTDGRLEVGVGRGNYGL